jgi:5'-nucleotidase/UDP-sugar diphosphatase
LKVHPFGNTVVTLDLTGAELVDYLAAAAKMSPGSGGFPQFGGIVLTITSGGIQDVRIQGNAIDPARVYRMAINSFMAVGGDGYPRMDAHRGFVNTGFVDADVLRSFIADNSPLKAAVFEPGNSVTRN